MKICQNSIDGMNSHGKYPAENSRKILRHRVRFISQIVSCRSGVFPQLFCEAMWKMDYFKVAPVSGENDSLTLYNAISIPPANDIFFHVIITTCFGMNVSAPTTPSRISHITRSRTSTPNLSVRVCKSRSCLRTCGDKSNGDVAKHSKSRDERN